MLYCTTAVQQEERLHTHTVTDAGARQVVISNIESVVMWRANIRRHGVILARPPAEVGGARARGIMARRSTVPFCSRILPCQLHVTAAAAAAAGQNYSKPDSIFVRAGNDGGRRRPGISRASDDGRTDGSVCDVILITCTLRMTSCHVT